MAERASETSVPKEPTADEKFVDWFREQVSPMGYKFECVGMTIKGITSFGAYVVPDELYDLTLETQNAERIAMHNEYYKYFDGPIPPFDPTESLDWEHTIYLPTYSGGHETREAAIAASVELLLT